MVRYALFSDIHANLPALQAVLRDIVQRADEQPFDAIYCLGDLGGYGGEPNEVQHAVMASGYPTLSGNYDQSVAANGPDCGCHYTRSFDIEMSAISFTWTRDHTTDANKDWLGALPAEIRLRAEEKQVLLCHGSPRDSTEYLFENRSDGFLRQFTPGGRADARAEVIVCGHTHVPYHRVVDGIHFVNTGSVGRPKDGNPDAGYCVLTVSDAEVLAEQIRVPYDIESACERLLAVGLPPYFADYLRTGGALPAL